MLTQKNTVLPLLSVTVEPDLINDRAAKSLFIHSSHGSLPQSTAPSSRLLPSLSAFLPLSLLSFLPPFFPLTNINEGSTICQKLI